MARQDKTKRGRITPKGTPPGRSEPDRPRQDFGPGPSSPIVPILMFSLLALGTLVILVNYLFDSLGSNWILLGGLGMILGGIVAATRYR